MAAETELGSPLADNLRAGNWMMDYIFNRLLSRYLSSSQARIQDFAQRVSGIYIFHFNTPREGVNMEI